LRSDAACGLMRDDGMTLPANGEPVRGSTSWMGRPNASTLWEKSPFRSRRVGTRTDCALAL
jgi:hypothetical protein